MTKFQLITQLYKTAAYVGSCCSSCVQLLLFCPLFLSPFLFIASARKQVNTKWGSFIHWILYLIPWLSFMIGSICNINFFLKSKRTFDLHSKASRTIATKVICNVRCYCLIMLHSFLWLKDDQQRFETSGQTRRNQVNYISIKFDFYMYIVLDYFLVTFIIHSTSVFLSLNKPNV